MARYRALSRGQLPGQRLVEPGEEFETDAPKGRWMELLPDEPEQEKPRRGRPPSE